MFFDFPILRLIDPATGMNDNRWRDPHGTPYAALGYDKTINNYPAVMCYGVAPYKEKGHTLNMGSMQIISAGADKAFGPGGDWVAGQGAWSMGQPGADDLSNFRSAMLGAE